MDRYKLIRGIAGSLGLAGCIALLAGQARAADPLAPIEPDPIAAYREYSDKCSANAAKSFAEHAVKADGAPDLPCQRPALSIAAKEKG